MKPMYTATVTLLAGIAIGAAMMEGLHAQATKLKAYSVSEFETFDNATQSTYLPSARQAIEAHHGKALRTATGRVVHIEGAAPPKNAGLVEWDSVDDAVAFYKSDAWKAMQPQRDKTYKLIRRYVVETEK